jgi:hypothetical protein
MNCLNFVFREEAKPMSDFLSSKDLRIHAGTNWVMKRYEFDLIRIILFI